MQLSRFVTAALNAMTTLDVTLAHKPVVKTLKLYHQSSGW